MEKIILKAESREVGKKGINHRLREKGFIPAILYGKGLQPVGLTVNSKDFTTLMKGHSGLNALLHLEVSDRKEKSPLVVMLKDFQTDSISRQIVHVDLIKIDLNEKVHVRIPVHVTGKAVGQVKGGLIDLPRREIEVICLPDRIPETIEVDITPLDVGHSIHVNELKLPEGVELPHGSDFAVVSIVMPKEEEVAAPVAATPEAGVPGAPAAAPAGAPAEGAAAPRIEKPEKGEKAEKK